MEAPIVAAIIAGSVLILVNVFQFLTNKRISKENEKLKFDYQKKLEETKINSELVKQLEIDRQEYTKHLINEIYLVRKTTQELIEEWPLDFFGKRSEFKYKLSLIENSFQSLVNIYRSGICFSSLMQFINSGALHDIEKTFKGLRSKLYHSIDVLDKKERYFRTFEVEHELLERIKYFFDVVSKYEQVLKEYLSREHDKNKMIQ